ncbi:MAG: TatD family hydrolase [Bacteroidaceae bacterium]|nr:TatD family hydrolase [Bacteroidaceae bacterium]
MAFLNIHTHHPCPEGEYTYPSFGIHPWFITERWEEQLKELQDSLLTIREKEPFFIGECGLDKLASTSYPIQLSVFEAQIALANKLSRPMIIHCVRATDDLLRLRKKAQTPWVYHGFRGNPVLMQQLLRAGIDISFGLRFNSESIILCPAEHFFLETDEGNRNANGNVENSIIPLYKTVATLRGTTEKALINQLAINASNYF